MHECIGVPTKATILFAVSSLHCHCYVYWYSLQYLLLLWCLWVSLVMPTSSPRCSAALSESTTYSPLMFAKPSKSTARFFQIARGLWPSFSACCISLLVESSVLGLTSSSMWKHFLHGVLLFCHGFWLKG